jgi:hypothetical protein
LWPGAYGQRYDAKLSPEERVGLDTFLSIEKSHARFRVLLGIDRFADPETFRPGERSRYSASPVEPPNAELAALLSDLTLEAIVRELRDQPDFPSYQYALLGLADERCGGIDEFLPAQSWRLLRTDFQQFRDEAVRANAWQAQYKARRLAVASGVSLGHGPAPAAPGWVEFRFLVERGLKVSSKPWTLALEKGTYDFTAPPSARVALKDVLLAEVGQRDATVRELSFDAASSDRDRYCRYLQRRSRAALTAIK